MKGAIAMLFLHTSDWHAGRTTYNEPRMPDLVDAMSEIIEIAKQRRPDGILHSGDLIDHSRVSHNDIERVVGWLAELAAIAPTIVVAGNHDNVALHRYLDKLGRLHQLHFVSHPLGANGDYLIVPGRDGTRARVGVLPFIYPQRLTTIPDAQPWSSTYREQLADLQARIAAGLADRLDPRSEVTLFTAHMHVTGAGLAGSERARHTTDEFAVDPDAIPAVDYAAFGHIHQPQQLPGRVVGRYAGSPIPLDFGEAGQRKSVTLVTVEPGKAAVCEEVPLRGGRELIKFDGTWDELQQQAGAIGDALCLVTVHTPAYEPALAQRVHTLLAKARVLDVQQRVDGAQPRNDVVEPGQTQVQRSLLESFEQYVNEHGAGTAPIGTVTAMMAEFLAAEQDERDPYFPAEEQLRVPAGGVA
ncbi:nuclease SbcCD subunit D [Pilimelia terevasa]|uniref:Nuclease SbcCD subunit D n=1 Tax=Pilimelia terevasa TaxID=53372 RepID=A0A8J3FL04_9ACTN|nr:exonuclease SbcCD subunit D [Pilimelia terevasa]GGK36216.1 nuclease SbcCD subunit D [Pilimelia terevasa]